MFRLEVLTGAMSNKDIVQELRHLPKVLKEFVDDSTNLVDSLRKFVAHICTLVEEATQKIDYLKHSEINYDARATFGESLPNIYRRAMLCISSTGKVLHYGQDEGQKESVMDGLEHDNWQPLRDFLGLLQRSLAQAKHHFAEFKETCETANQNCTTAATECMHNSRKAKSKKIATRVVGGVAAASTALAGGTGAAVALTGVALSIAAGPVTFGIGTVVGLGITAVVSAATGTVATGGAAVVTHVLASDFKATEKKFSELAATFQSMWATGSHTLVLISALETKLELLTTVMDDVNYCVTNNHPKQSVSCTLEFLFSKFSESSAVIASCQEKMTSEIEAKGLSEYL
jgi:hypothetical protein